MSLETMTPATDWEPSDHTETVETFRALAGEITIKVWGGDWCGDTQDQLPEFAAALDAAGIPRDDIEMFPVDENKQGPGVDEYGIEYIPTIVIEQDGTEQARFVESAAVPPAEYLAEKLQTTVLKS